MQMKLKIFTACTLVLISLFYLHSCASNKLIHAEKKYNLYFEVKTKGIYLWHTVEIRVVDLASGREQTYKEGDFDLSSDANVESITKTSETTYLIQHRNGKTITVTAPH